MCGFHIWFENFQQRDRIPPPTQTEIPAPGADSEEKREPVSDIDTAVVDSLKRLTPNGRLIVPLVHRQGKRHLLLQPSDGLILVSGLRLEGHSVIFLAIQTHLSCRFLLTVDFLGPTPERVLAADHRSAVGFSETGRGSPPPPPIGT